MILRSLTGESFTIVMPMPQMNWKGFYVLYDFNLPEERRVAMLHLVEAQLIAPNEGRIPHIQRIELHASSDEKLQGYIVVVFEKMTKVYEYMIEDVRVDIPEIDIDEERKKLADELRQVKEMEMIIGMSVNDPGWPPGTHKYAMRLKEMGLLYLRQGIFYPTKLGKEWLDART